MGKILAFVPNKRTKIEKEQTYTQDGVYQMQRLRSAEKNAACEESGASKVVVCLLTSALRVLVARHLDRVALNKWYHKL